MMKPSVSIVTASRNETAMLSVTALSALEALREAGVDGEVLVVDNSDEEYHAAARAALGGNLKGSSLRLLHEPAPSAALATDRAHREAHGDLILYIDAHCMIGSGTLSKMVDFFSRHDGEPIGMLHAPIQWAHYSPGTRRTHFCTSRTLLGEWAGAHKVKAEQKVTWKGMPHMCRKSMWLEIGGLGCLAEHRLGWGIMRYIGIKPWLYGFQNWAIPDGVVYHFGEWPEEVKKHVNYRTYKPSPKELSGAAMAVTAYIFGGEDLLRSEFELAGMSRFFKSVEDAVELSRRLGGTERRAHIEAGRQDLQELVNLEPWNS